MHESSSTSVTAEHTSVTNQAPEEYTTENKYALFEANTLRFENEVHNLEATFMDRYIAVTCIPRTQIIYIKGKY